MLALAEGIDQPVELDQIPNWSIADSLAKGFGNIALSAGELLVSSGEEVVLHMAAGTSSTSHGDLFKPESDSRPRPTIPSQYTDNLIRHYFADLPSLN